MFLIAGTTDDEKQRIVFVGKGGWSYDKPLNLIGFNSKTEAEVERMTLNVDVSIFRAVLGAPGPRSDLPPLKWLKVVEFKVSVPDSEPRFVIRAENRDGDVVWFGLDVMDPALDFKGLRPFRSRATAIERKEQLRISDTHGRTFLVKELVRKAQEV